MTAADAQRLRLKLYVPTGQDPHPEIVIRLFHRLVRDQVFDDLLIDVADYSHVHRGPGIALIGHGIDLYFEHSDGRPGLVVCQKRDRPGDFAARLRDGMRRTLQACRVVEDGLADDLPGFGLATEEILLRYADRLHAPNTDDTHGALRAGIAEFFAMLHATPAVDLQREGHDREPYSVRIRCPRKAVSVTELLARLD